MALSRDEMRQQIRRKNKWLKVFFVWEFLARSFALAILCLTYLFLLYNPGVHITGLDKQNIQLSFQSLSTVIGIIILLFVWAIWEWKKWGVYTWFTIQIITFLQENIQLPNSPWANVIVIAYFVAVFFLFRSLWRYFD